MTSNMNINFKITVPAYNCEKWIGKTIQSIKSQSYTNFQCIIVDDLSTDNTFEIVKAEINGDSRFSCVKNIEKKFALKNFIDCFQILGSSEEDVYVTIDGDDWLATDKALDIISNTYKNTNCLITYGSFVEYPSGITHPYYLTPYESFVINNNAFRDVPWKASHLRTFKKKLWDRIDIEDLKDEKTGTFYEVAWDLAMMLPMLEMAAERSAHISEIVYVYNKQNPLSDMYIKEDQQLLAAKNIKYKNKYKKAQFK